jgi:hypothetical protein
MAKATIEFDLDNPDDVMAHLRCVKATAMASALFEIEMNMKKRMEWTIEAKEMSGETVKPYDVIDWTMDYILEAIHGNGINVEELIN